MKPKMPQALVQELNELMERRQKGSPPERQAVLTRLTDYERSNKIPLPFILEMADDANPSISMYAIGALGRSGKPEAVQKLLAMAQAHAQGHPLFLETIVDALGEAGDHAATPVLLELLGIKTGWKSKLLGKLSVKKDDEGAAQERFKAYFTLPIVRTLAKLQDPKCGEAFGLFLGHEDPLVRWHSIDGIVRTGLTSYIPRLKEMAQQDENELVREMAAIAVGKMEKPSPVLVN
ncbi:MAG TPA: HEAT repeat domain-containing protein [bacterium]|nr:HEAT repeat domain-containing protein [bacterium]